VVSLHSSYALVTQPASDLGPLTGGAMIWETARPYMYLRATPDQRILVGGVDVPFKNSDARDALLPVRTRQLERYLERVFGASLPATAFAWSGTFGETRDGLPRIGRIPGRDHAYAALGYGGNGIVFSHVAADLLGALCSGQAHEDETLFGFTR
jgi:glycine/D-amino acid oxidase-like deaminating enzyme